MTDPLFRRMLGPNGRAHFPNHVEAAIGRALVMIEREEQLIAWTGESGRGKTISAMMLVDRMKSAYPHAQEPACYTQLIGRHGPSTAGQQLGIYNVYADLIATLSPGLQSAKRGNGMITEIVEHCRLHGTRLLVLDEAGTQSAEQLRGIANIAEVARRSFVPLTILMLGMDELPSKLHAWPQVRRRISTWETFRDWPRADLETVVYAHSAMLAAHRTDLGMGPVMDLLVARARGCVARLVATTLTLQDWLKSRSKASTAAEVLSILRSIIRDEDRRQPPFAA